MIDSNKTDAETADVNDISCHHRVQISRVHTVFLKPSFENPKRQPRPVHRCRNLLHYIRQSTNMIFMSVRKDDRLDFILVLNQISDIRNNKINAEHIFLREHQPRVYNENLIVHPDGSHILSDLT